MTIKTVKCPNCGSSATNLQNCEFCGSLFVRFPILNLETEKYIQDNLIYSGLEEKIQEALGYCESYEFVNIYIKLGNKSLFQLSRSSMVKKYLNNLQLSYSSEINDGIGIVNIFDKNEDLYMQRFLDLEESILFYQSSEIENSFFAIDYGKDIKAAALLSSILLNKVYRINPNSILNIEIEHWNEKDLINDNKKSGCFIATATMGSYDHSEVLELRHFRDNWILQKSWGVSFVKWYYHYGSIAAKYIEKSVILKKICYLFIVSPLVYLSRVVKK